jgi:hypothetical protein
MDAPEPRGTNVTPTQDTIADWVARTVEVRALELAQNLAFGMSALLCEEGTTCGLSCGSVEAASKVYAVLEEHAEEWCIVPELIATRAIVYVYHHTFDAT